MANGPANGAIFRFDRPAYLVRHVCRPLLTGKTTPLNASCTPELLPRTGLGAENLARNREIRRPFDFDNAGGHYCYMENLNKIIGEGFTFDDVLMVPGRSDFVPSEADTRTRLTRRIELNLPLISAPMDTVTEAALAIALAQEGGLGCIHKNMSIEHQCTEVEKVKRSANGIITDPLTLPPDATVGRARQIMKEQNISGIPIVDATDGA